MKALLSVAFAQARRTERGQQRVRLRRSTKRRHSSSTRSSRHRPLSLLRSLTPLSGELDKAEVPLGDDRDVEHHLPDDGSAAFLHE